MWRQAVLTSHPMNAPVALNVLHSSDRRHKMTSDQSEQVIEVIAVADDGTTYRIERRCQFFHGEEHPSFFYCCLSDGQLVAWLGSGRYQLPDGTVVQEVASHIRH